MHLTSDLDRRARLARRALLATFACSVLAVGPAALPAAAVSPAESLVDAQGGADHLGPDSSFRPAAELVAVASTPDRDGYWLASADGGVFTFGAATFHGAAAGTPLRAPVVDIEPGTGGYWLASADGGVFTFGSVDFHGSAGGLGLAAPIIGMAATPDGDGYWLAAVDGGVFSFGNAPFEGSATGVLEHGHVVGIAATPTGRGYWLATSEGQVLSFGDAEFHGDLGGGASEVQAIAPADDGGYLLVRADGTIDAFGTDDPGDGLDLEALTVDVAAGRPGESLTVRRSYDRPEPLAAAPLVDPNHPFLVCTRAHESDSSGGYQAVSASGAYRGAYQFSQATWDSTARHAGRLDLAGVDPAAAAPADQDLLALHLYQWQGAAPWNGRCAGL